MDVGKGSCIYQCYKKSSQPIQYRGNSFHKLLKRAEKNGKSRRIIFKMRKVHPNKKKTTIKKHKKNKKKKIIIIIERKINRKAFCECISKRGDVQRDKSEENRIYKEKENGAWIILVREY
jgi:hypothetical protein